MLFELSGEALHQAVGGHVVAGHRRAETADAEPAGLYPSGNGRFEFDRTVSRLEEMQSADYLGEGHGLHED